MTGDVICKVFMVNENQPLSDGYIFQDQIKSKLVAESRPFMMKHVSVQWILWHNHPKDQKNNLS